MPSALQLEIALSAFPPVAQSTLGGCKQRQVPFLAVTSLQSNIQCASFLPLPSVSNPSLRNTPPDILPPCLRPGSNSRAIRMLLSRSLSQEKRSRPHTPPPTLNPQP
eukprot:1098067-Rhodomonas_salina.2